MAVNHTRSFNVGCSTVFLLCLVGGLILIRYQKMTSCYNGRPPLQGFNLTSDRSQQQLQLFINQSEKFSDKHDFRFQLAYYTPNSANFSIWMKRKDVELIIWNTPVDPGHFDANFYNNDCIHPTSTADIEDLAIDLKSYLSEIPNLTIVEEQ